MTSHLIYLYCMQRIQLYVYSMLHSAGFPLESDFIVVLPMQNEFEKSASK